MDTTTQPVLKNSSNKCWRTTQEKRQIVEATFAPGASVARVARAHGVNANQLFHWRRLYRGGLLSDETADQNTGANGARTPCVSLLPVVVADAADNQLAASRPLEVAHAAPAERKPSPSGSIELKLTKGQVRIAGAVEPEVLRVVLQYLL